MDELKQMKMLRESMVRIQEDDNRNEGFTDAEIETDIDNDDMWDAGDGDLSVDDYRAMSNKENISARVKARRERGHMPGDRNKGARSFRNQ